MQSAPGLVIIITTFGELIIIVRVWEERHFGENV
jgi:hypothetical protein